MLLPNMTDDPKPDLNGLSRRAHHISHISIRHIISVIISVFKQGICIAELMAQHSHVLCSTAKILPAGIL